MRLVRQLGVVVLTCLVVAGCASSYSSAKDIISFSSQNEQSTKIALTYESSTSDYLTLARVISLTPKSVRIRIEVTTEPGGLAGTSVLSVEVPIGEPIGRMQVVNDKDGSVVPQV